MKSSRLTFARPKRKPSPLLPAANAFAEIPQFLRYLVFPLTWKHISLSLSCSPLPSCFYLYLRGLQPVISSRAMYAFGTPRDRSLRDASSSRLSQPVSRTASRGVEAPSSSPATFLALMEREMQEKSMTPSRALGEIRRPSAAQARYLPEEQTGLSPITTERRQYNTFSSVRPLPENQGKPKRDSDAAYTDTSSWQHWQWVQEHRPLEAFRLTESGQRSGTNECDGKSTAHEPESKTPPLIPPSHHQAPPQPHPQRELEFQLGPATLPQLSTFRLSAQLPLWPLRRALRLGGSQTGLVVCH